jgi:hypothetical protein
MDDEQHYNEPEYFIKDEQKWLEAEKYKADIEKLKIEKYSELGYKTIDSIKEYVIKGQRNITIAGFILIGLIFVSMAGLTYYGKVGGETFALATGTIIGYIISILKQGT